MSIESKIEFRIKQRMKYSARDRCTVQKQDDHDRRTYPEPSNFNTDEDFMTNDEAANLEDPAQDGSQTGEGVTVTGASGENTLTTNLAPMISPYW
uniref:Uncharacterized protein n=1 Tax=Vitis vinifera TaxID=29760 RepID=A5AMV3_VITVI|nr:hypothetical protein VITISV_002084 [Vitis vinifera]